jgi:hypothetical protein
LEPPPPPPFLDTPDAEKPPEKKSRFAALPQRKLAIWSLAGLIALSVVGFLIWKPPTTIIGWFRSAPSLPRTADTRDTAARPKIADRIGGPSTSPSADEGTRQRSSSGRVLPNPDVLVRKEDAFSLSTRNSIAVIESAKKLIRGRPPPRRRWLRRKTLLQGDFFERAGRAGRVTAIAPS